MIYKSAFKSVKKSGNYKGIKILQNGKKNIFYHYPSIDLQGESILSPRRLTYEWWRFLRERSFYTDEIKKGQRKIKILSIFNWYSYQYYWYTLYVFYWYSHWYFQFQYRIESISITCVSNGISIILWIDTHP